MFEPYSAERSSLHERMLAQVTADMATSTRYDSMNGAEGGQDRCLR